MVVRYLNPLLPFTLTCWATPWSWLPRISMGGVIAHPVNARRWLQTIIDEIAQDQALVERLLNNRL